MTTAEIHTKLQEGFEDIEAGRVQDAKAAFAAFSGKRKLYEEYRAAKKEMMDYQIAKQGIDKFLKIDEEQRQKEKIKEYVR